nr:MAG TPA: hypothetical protein [Caudoviricetes sp.]
MLIWIAFLAVLSTIVAFYPPFIVPMILIVWFMVAAAALEGESWGTKIATTIVVLFFTGMFFLY